jgi:urease beta subunit
MIPGEYFLAGPDIVANAGREVTTVTVVNTGDRPVQVGSHFHFFEVNRQMAFDRAQALGKRLNIAAGTAVRFEPGEEKVVDLIPFGGRQVVTGFNSLVNGETAAAGPKQAAMARLAAHNFKDSPA